MARGVQLIILGLMCLASGGCLEDVLGVMLAPESVVGDAANNVASTAAQSLSGLQAGQLTDTAQALQDVNRLIQNSGDPDAQARLAALRDQLIANQNLAQGGSQLGDFTHADLTGGQRRPLDGMSSILIPAAPATVTMQLPSDSTRRPQARPDVLESNSALQHDDAPSFMLSLKPVRLSQ